MKNFVILLLLCAFSSPTYIFAQSKSRRNTEVCIFKHGVEEIDAAKLVKTLQMNVKGYVEHCRFSKYEIEEFRKPFDYFCMQACLTQYPRRFSTDAFGSLHDELGYFNKDSFPLLYVYDKNNNAITIQEYRKLSDKKKKKYYSFNAIGEVVRFINIVADKIIKQQKEDYPLDY